MNTQKQIALIVFLTFFMVAGCAAYTYVDLPFRAPAQQEWHDAESVHRGALLFANNCRTCHGNKGEGGVGLPLNTEQFQNQDPLVLERNRDLLTRTLNCGRAGTRMPAWLADLGGSLNERQIEHLVNLITAPATEVDAEGEPTSHGWEQAIEVAHHLNEETILVVGGDTLNTIAQAHLIGVNELVELNPDFEADELLPDGTSVTLLDGPDYTVRNDNETLEKIAETTFTGAIVLARLNNIPYELTERLGVYFFALGDSEVSTAVGLIPGATIALSEGAQYVVRADDTLDSIAAAHNVAADEILSMNEELLGDIPTDEPIASEASLALPENPVVIFGDADTLASVADQHGIEVDELAELNGLANAEAEVAPGTQLNLPPDSRYTIQAGDTLDSVSTSHATTPEELAELNPLVDSDPLATLENLVILEMPPVGEYVIAGQSLEDISATLSNASAADIGEAQDPPVEAEHVYPVGTNLLMPEDAWGTAPPDTINNGTACVEHAVPQSVFEDITGEGPDIPDPPEEVSDEVVFEANSNDWVVVADGEPSEPNEGTARVAIGSTVQFVAVTGFHNIFRNEIELDGEFNAPEEQEFSFDEEGIFLIECTIHPGMQGYVFVGDVEVTDEGSEGEAADESQ